MAKFTIKNLTANPVHLGDFYTTIQPGATIVLTNRSADELPGLSSVQKQIVAGAISLLVEYTDDEKSSGMLSPPEAIGAEDDAPVAAAAVPAPLQAFFKAFAAGAGGAADDVVIFAANNLPYKVRVLRADMFVSTNVGASSCVVRDEAAGAGTAVATFDTATTGAKADATVTAPVLLTPGATKGLFVRRSDSGVAGSVVLYVRREI